MSSSSLTVHSHPWHDRAHHTPHGFRNPWPLAPSLDDIAPGRLQRARFIAEFFLGSKEQTPAPSVALDPAALFEPVPDGSARVTWLGHTTVLVQTPGANVLTDPVWANRAGPYGLGGPKRQVAPPIAIEDLPPIHVVLQSHDHYDHLDPAAVRALQARHAPHFVVPMGVERRLAEWIGEADVTVMDWGQYTDVRGLRLHMTPARHFAGRTMTDRNTTLWASYLIEPLAEDAPTVYFAGDSGYGPHFVGLRERFGAPDAVLMPIGAYLPRWMMRPIHVDPSEAVQAFLDLGAETLIATHWGTFDLTQEPLDEPPRALGEAASRAGVAERMVVLPVGGTRTVERSA